jgi:hypothetical protein
VPAPGASAYTGGGDYAGGDSQPEGVDGMVHISPIRTALDAHRALLRIDGSPLIAERSITSPSSQVPRPPPLCPRVAP